MHTMISIYCEHSATTSGHFTCSAQMGQWKCAERMDVCSVS